MKTMKMQLVETFHAPDAPLLVRAAYLVWENLPLLLCADLALCLAVLPVIAVWMVDLPLLAPWIAMLTLGPVWAATSAVANSLVKGESANWRSLLKALKEHWRAASSLSIVPALVATIFIGSWQILVLHPRMTWLYVPLFVDGCVATFVALACLSAFSLTTSRGLRGWKLWKVSLAVTTLRLGRVFGILALFLVLELVLMVVNAGLLPLLCAPLALCLAAQTNQTCEFLLSRETQV